MDFVELVKAEARDALFVKPNLTAEYLNKTFLLGINYTQWECFGAAFNHSVMALLTTLTTFYKNCLKIVIMPKILAKSTNSKLCVIFVHASA